MADDAPAAAAPAITDLSSPAVTDKYRAAALIASTAMKGVLTRLTEGSSIADICDFGDKVRLHCIGRAEQLGRRRRRTLRALRPIFSAVHSVERPQRAMRTSQPLDSDGAIMMTEPWLLCRSAVKRAGGATVGVPPLPLSGRIADAADG